MTNPTRILIVDDDLLTTASISQTLLRGGYQTIHASSRSGALKAIRREQPDLVICNLDGRKFNAHRFLQSLNEEREARGIPFLFLVESHRRTGPAPEILGPKQYLKKPFTREELTSAVHDHLHLSKPPRPPE